MTRAKVVAASLVAILSGCSGMDDEAAKPWPVSSTPLTVTASDWNPGNADLGHVEAIAELAGDVVFFGDKGAIAMAGGRVFASDAKVVKWSSASVIPAADRSGFWVVGIDESGQVHRLRARSELEPVSDRYGLAKDAVRAAIPLGGDYIGFVLDGSVAIPDGAAITRYDIAESKATSGGAKLLAGVGPDGQAQLFDASKAATATLGIEGAKATAFDGAGRLYAQTANEIYVREKSGAISVAYRSPSGDLHGLTAAAGRVWFGEGSELGAMEENQIAKSQGAQIPKDGELVGSPSGEVWILSGGKVTKMKVPVTGDEATWQSTVLPVYARVCSECHAPGASSEIDLSTYAAWQKRREAVFDRVVVKKDMPLGRAIADDERAAIGAWATPK